MSAHFKYYLELFGKRLAGGFDCNVNFKEYPWIICFVYCWCFDNGSILKALGSVAVDFIKKLVSEITGGVFNRDLLITPTSVVQPISEVCYAASQVLYFYYYYF